MRARLKDPYTGPAGRFDAGRVVTDQQIPRDQLQAMISGGHASAMGTIEVERPTQAVPETADLKPKEVKPDRDWPRHKGGGHYELSNGESVRGKEAARKAQAELNG